MPIRNLFAATTAALLTGVALAAPALASSSVQPVAATYGMTSGRFVPTVLAVLGLTGVVIGGLALRSAGRTETWARGSIAALVAGLISTVLGVLFAVNAEGGLGTGNGLGGAIVAAILGLIGMALGGLALVRARRTS